MRRVAAPKARCPVGGHEAEHGAQPVSRSGGSGPAAGFARSAALEDLDRDPLPDAHAPALGGARRPPPR